MDGVFLPKGLQHSRHFGKKKNYKNGGGVDFVKRCDLIVYLFCFGEVNNAFAR